MKLTVVFDIPDDQAATYVDVAEEMVKHHAFAQRQAIKHWSFDVEMRPVAAFLADIAGDLAEAAHAARREVDQEHPWIPGAIFGIDERLKPALLAFLDALISG
jgi:hypothetical protein